MANLKKSVIDIISDPPASPIFDARYVVLPAGTGAWAGHDNEIAKDDSIGGWGFDIPQEGWFLYVEAQERIYIFNGTEWIPASISFSDDPALDTTFAAASAGTSTLVSRADHVHSLGAAVAPPPISDLLNDAGSSDIAARSDHTHGVLTDPPVDVGAMNNKGSAKTLSLSDHVHAHGDQAGGTLHAVATTSTDGFMSAQDKDNLDTVVAAPPGLGLSSDDPEPVGTVADDGVSASASKSDHVHAHADQPGGTLHADVIAGGASGFMSGTDKTNLDTVVAAPPGLGLSSDDPEPIGIIADDGVSASASKSDHVHAHDDQPGGTLHAEVVSGGDAGFMAGADKLKLDGIAANADVSPVASVHGRTGAVVAAQDDYALSQISGEINDTQHGDRDGGTLHADVTTTVAGFMSAADKINLDAVVAAPPGLALSNADPLPIGMVDDGVSTEASKSDHVHAHGDQGGGTEHAEVVANGDAGFMSGSDKDKLDNLTPGGGGREFPAASGFSAAVGGNQNGISNNDVVLIFVLEWEDEPDWTGYQAIGSNTGEGTVTSLRTGRYAFDLDLHFLRQESGDKDLFLEWKINGVVVKEMWQFLSRLSLSRFNMKWVGWLNIESGDELELFFRNPADGPATEDFTLEMGKQFLRLTRLD